MTQLQWQYLESMVGAMTSDEKRRLASMISDAAPPRSDPARDPWIGCMADESELLDEIMKSVYLARETHPLRAAD
jgi:hypothetical protein